MSVYIRLLKHLLAYKSTVIIAVLCMVVFALTNGAMAYLIGPVMKFLFTSGGDEVINLVPYNLFPLEREQMLYAVPFAIIIVAVVKGGASFGQTYLMGFVGQRVVVDIREKLYRQILGMPLNYFSENTTGELTARMTYDVNMLHNMTTETFSRVMKQCLTIVVLASVVISMDWKLSLVAFVAFPAVIYPMVNFGRKVKKASKKGQETVGMMTSLLNEAISGVRIVKAFCMEGYEAGKFQIENERLAKYHMKNIKVRAISGPMMEAMGAIGFAATIYYAAYRINAGTLAPENFISFFAAVMMLYQPIKALNGVNLNLQNGLAAAQRIFDLLDEKTEEDLMAGERTLDTLSESIEFRAVDFKYGDKKVLNSINLKVKKGEMAALVGMSGAGKSTLVNLLPRFFDVTSGSLLFDGNDIRDFTLKSLRNNVAIVSQQVILFNDTIKNNLAYGDTHFTDAEVMSAAIAANIDGFIKKLPKGYDTVIGEGGFKLSGGERQRLSIARAILKNAPILIMDEATSALDTDSEIEVQKGLSNLMSGRTTFVIAHRLSTVRNADVIFVLKDGELKEVGNHDKLLEIGGEYSRLYTMQIHGSFDSTIN